MTATGPLAAYDGQWLERVANRQFMTTAASLVGVSGWYAIAPFFLAAVVAVGLGMASLPSFRVTVLDAVGAVGVARWWAVAALGSYNEWGHTPSGRVRSHRGYCPLARRRVAALVSSRDASQPRHAAG